MIAVVLRDLEAVFGWLLAASWQASVLAVLVLALQSAVRGRLNPRWRYALWLLVLVRLVVPALPESALSLFQFAPRPPVAIVVPVTEPLFVAPPVASPQIEMPAAATFPFSFYSLLAILWLAGALTLFILTWRVNHRFNRQVVASPEISDPKILRIFAEAKAELGIRRAIRLIESGQIVSPAIMGLFQPTLLLPTNVRDQFDATELRLIFLHELAHLKRGDVVVQALIALLQILHWFNPVLWFAFRRMRIDREPATDALVLSRTGEEEKERYGLMLIKLLEHFNQRHSLPTLVGILEDKDQFKRRFSLIARFTHGAYGWSLLGVALIGVLSVACLTAKEADASTASSALEKTPPPPIYVWYNKIGLGFFGPIGHEYSISDDSHTPGTNHTLSVFCQSFTEKQATLVFIESWPSGPSSNVSGQKFQPTGEKRREVQIPLGKVYTFQIFDAVDVTTSPVLKPDPSLISANSFITPPPGKQQIEVGLQVIEVDDDDYQAHAAEMDAAVEKADIGYFNKRKGVDLLSTPRVATPPGQKANIEVVREFPYPTSFANGKVMPGGTGSGGQTFPPVVVPPTPREFATKDVGITAEITPTIDDGNTADHGKIVLNGTLKVVYFEGFTKSNLVGTGTPSFTTRESNFIEAIADRQEKGIWIPGGRFDEETVTDKDDSGKILSEKKMMVKKRLLLFMSAKLVK